MGKYIDFDAARAERKKEPLIVKLFGKKWELPPSLPADIPVEISRLHASAGPGAEIDNGIILSLMSCVVPNDIMKAWCEAGLDSEDYGSLLIMIIKEYMGTSDSQGEAKAPKKGAKKKG
jgi:hypothetical protein